MDKPQERIRWYYEPLVVTLLLFLVLGPFGLPLVYKSPKFNKTWKIILTLLTVIYTGYLLWATVVSMEAVFRNDAPLRALLGYEPPPRQP